MFSDFMIPPSVHLVLLQNSSLGLDFVWVFVYRVNTTRYSSNHLLPTFLLIDAQVPSSITSNALVEEQ